MKINIVCSSCGSENVCWDASAIWNKEKQEWEVGALCDATICNECYKENSLKEVKIDG